MDLDDYVDGKMGVAVAATAVALSPRVREVLHRGAVYGLAGVLAAGDAVTAFARGVGDGARRTRGRAAREGAGEEDTSHAEGSGGAGRRRHRRAHESTGGEDE